MNLRALQDIDTIVLASFSRCLSTVLSVFFALLLAVSNCFAISTPEIAVLEAHALREDALKIDEKVETISLGKFLVYVEDQESSLTIEDLVALNDNQFQKQKQDIPSFPFSLSTFWFKVNIVYKPSQSLPNDKKTFFLELAHPPLDIVDLFTYDDRSGLVKSLAKTGTKRDFNQRLIKHRNYIFPITLHADRPISIYLKVSMNGSIKMPLTLWDPSRHLEHETNQSYLLGLYFGIMLVMVLYNFFLYLSIKDIAYLYYIIYISFFSFTIAAMTGHGFMYFWPHFTWWNDRAIAVLSSCALLFAIFFSQSFLNTKFISPSIHKILNGFALFCISIIIGALFTEYDFSRGVVALGITFPFIALAAGITCWKKGKRAARFFTLAWAFLMSGIFVSTLVIIDFLPSITVTRIAVIFGSLMEVILLSLALADRINVDKSIRYHLLKKKSQVLVALKDAEADILFRALHNPTTNLPNQTFLEAVLEKTINAEEGLMSRFSVFLIQITNLQEIKHTLGQKNGDAFLREVCQTINTIVAGLSTPIDLETIDHKTHYIANIDNSTLSMVLKLNNEIQAQMSAETLLKITNTPFKFNDISIDVHLHIGISIFPEHGSHPDTLLRNATVAAELASEKSSRTCIFHPDQDPYSAERLSLMGELKTAILDDQLALHFQPQIDLRHQSVIGVEALLRWNHPTLGNLPPDQFIPIAEQTGVIHTLSEWVLDKSLTYCRKLIERGFPISMSVNLSASNLQEENLCSTIESLLKKYDIPPEMLILELTETAMMKNPEQALEVLQRISATQIRISIDDYGTGYSSLAYIKRLPINEIKIDRSFVSDMSNNSDDRIIVHTTLEMSHNLGLRVIAEGVEDEKALNTLSAMKCDVAQGYFLSRPIPFDQLLIWLKETPFTIEKTNDANNRGSSKAS